MFLYISQLNPSQLSREQITKILFGDAKEDNGLLNADCIFVFGGSFMERVWKAVELYHAGRAPYILFSGGDKWGQRNPPEAIQMRDEAIRKGVPESAIITEILSNHTKENVLASLFVLDRAIGLHNIKRLLVVSAPGHMRRCLLTLRTYMPEWIEYIWCPDDRIQGQAHNWFQSEEEKTRVMKELSNLIKYVQEGQLMDEDIEL